MFRECLCHDVVPFIIDERHKQFYYRGLREFASTPGYLLDTCLLAQDIYGLLARKLEAEVVPAVVFIY